ncbi:MAG: acyl dehydratase, partial [Rhodocyclaceae bacterium]|nr:acyl dehydratase [Rhodocyclaceae bacterium]
MDTRYLDDLHAGQRFESGGITLTEAEIIDFAWRYDPQPFHLDANAAAESPYGG